jgi:hypothetical protein
MPDVNKVAQYVANWQDERNGAALYRAISEAEKNPRLKDIGSCIVRLRVGIDSSHD